MLLAAAIRNGGTWVVRMFVVQIAHYGKWISHEIGMSVSWIIKIPPGSGCLERIASRGVI